LEELCGLVANAGRSPGDKDDFFHSVTLTNKRRFPAKTQKRKGRKAHREISAVTVIMTRNEVSAPRGTCI
jgi:hypothetical protein